MDDVPSGVPREMRDHNELGIVIAIAKGLRNHGKFLVAYCEEELVGIER